MPDLRHLVKIDPDNPQPVYIQKAGKILNHNGTVIFPAQCLYGVAAHALRKPAIEEVFKLKQRPLTNPLLVLVKDHAMLETLVTDIPHHAQRLMNNFWPGNLTLVFQAQASLPTELTAGTGKIGIRIPSHPVARALVNHLDFPITGTSANLSGQPGCTKITQLDPSIAGQAGMILDAGPVKGGTGSTIVDVTGKTIQILREGIVTINDVTRALD